MRDSTAGRFNRDRDGDVIEGMARYGWTELEAQAVLKCMTPHGGLPFVAGDFGHQARRAAALGEPFEDWLESYRVGYPSDSWPAFVKPALRKVWESVAEGGDHA
jgi:hypothetical protein